MKRSDFRSAAALVAAVAILGLGGCGRETITAPKDAKITVSADPDHVSTAVGQTRIRVEVLNGIVPVRYGTLVYLTTDFGLLEPAEKENPQRAKLETNSNGEAFATLKSTATGKANLTATSGNATGAGSANFDPPGSLRLSLSYSPQSVQYDGSSVVTAHLKYLDNGQIPPPTAVGFSVTEGDGKFDNASVETNLQGDASSNLKAPNQTVGDVTVKVSAPGTSSDESGIISFYDIVGSIRGSAEPDSFPVQSSSKTITITATVKGKAKQTAMKDVTVVLTAEAGTFSSHDKSVSKVTGADGVVTDTLTLTASDQLGTLPKTIGVTMKGTDTRNNSVELSEAVTVKINP